VLSDVIWTDVSEVGTVEKNLKAGTRNGTF